MKKFTGVMMVIMMMLLTIGPTVFAYTEGAYEARAAGNNGDVRVKVTFTGDAIAVIEVVEHAETAGIGDAAIAKIPDAIIRGQTLAVDTVAGATRTSQAIIAAVTDCVTQAGGDVTSLLAAPAAATEAAERSASEPTEITTDVLVIGGGGAGLTAAIEAKNAGADVVVLERMDFLGGDTIRAGGGIEAAGTRIQEANGIIGDTPQAQYEFITSRGITYRNPELLRLMTDQAPAAVDFLVELGADLSGTPVAGHGSPVARAHRGPSGSAGQSIMNPVISEVGWLGIPVYLATPGQSLLTSHGNVVGAKAVSLADGQEVIIHAKAVVIATGNFVSNNEMVALYDQRLRGMDTNSNAGSLGEGIQMATAVGADLENMNIFRVTTAFPRGDNFVAISQDGERFMDETHTDDTIFRKGDDLHILVNENRVDKHYYAVFDSTEYAAHESAYAAYVDNGTAVSADTVAELAELIQLNPQTLEDSLNAWNDCVENGSDPLGRDVKHAAPIIQSPFYAVKVTPKMHTSAGGIRIDASAAVLDSQQNCIAGLYAAGEVTGGVHDGVSAVEGAIVYGRIAGQSAAAYALQLK